MTESVSRPVSVEKRLLPQMRHAHWRYFSLFGRRGLLFLFHCPAFTEYRDAWPLSFFVFSTLANFFGRAAVLEDPFDGAERWLELSRCSQPPLQLVRFVLVTSEGVL